MTFDSADPQFAARTANAFADEYVAHNLELKVETLNASADWLTGEVQKQGELVKESDLKLAQYKETQDAVSLDSNQNIVVARLTQSNDAATKARMNRIQKEGLWRQIQAAGDDVESITSVLNNPNIQNLRASINQLAQDKSRATERYGERHPEYQKAVTALGNAEAQLQAEIRKAVQNAKNEFDNAVQQEREMQGQLNESKKQATALGRKGVDYAVLLREAESNRAIYNQLRDAREGTPRRRQQPHQQRARGRQGGSARRAVLAESSPRLALCDRARHRARPGPRVRHRLSRRHRQDARRHRAAVEAEVPRPGADRVRRSPSADLGPGAARFRRSLSIDPHRARLTAARQRTAHRGGGQLAAARRQDDDGREHRHGAGRRRRARAADRRRHAAAERSQGAAHDQRPRLVAVARRPGAHARSGAAHARPEPADDHGRPHAGQPVGAAGVGSHARAAVGPRERPLRLDHHRHAAGARGHRRGDPRAARRRR